MNKIVHEDIKKFFIDIAILYNIEQEQQRDKLRRGERYNIFNILKLSTKELKHSLIISNLLDPKGSHGCGDSFLRAFFNIALNNSPYPFDDGEIVTSRTEVYAGKVSEEENGGRIDIIIQNANYGLIIENKIYARDQENQLIRYDNYGKQVFGEGQYCLIYLTLNGIKSQDAEKEKFSDYKCMSYSKNILAWLKQCVQIADDKPLVRESINQYIQTIKQLTYQDMEQENIQQIVELAIKNPEVVSTLGSNRDRIAQGIRKEYIFTPLEKYAEIEEWNIDIKEDCSEPNIRLTPKGWGKYDYIIISADTDGKKSNEGWWINLWIGVVKEVSEKGKEIKLKALKDSNELYPYGYEYLEVDNWYATENFPKMKQDVYKQIELKIKAIRTELGI